MQKASTRTYYEALLLGERTIGLTLDEARGDLERFHRTLARINLN